MMCSGMGWICILKDLVLNRRDYIINFFHVWLVMNKIKRKTGLEETTKVNIYISISRLNYVDQDIKITPYFDSYTG
jgi:hypothetical protein